MKINYSYAMSESGERTLQFEREQRIVRFDMAIRYDQWAREERSDE
jgi:hypothetical protein